VELETSAEKPAVVRPKRDRRQPDWYVAQLQQAVEDIKKTGATSISRNQSVNTQEWLQKVHCLLQLYRDSQKQFQTIPNFTKVLKVRICYTGMSRRHSPKWGRSKMIDD
jgi:hypothetical protein